MRISRNSRDRVNSDFVSLAVNLLDRRVIAVFVRDKVSGLDIAAIGILALSVEHLFVQFDVIIIDSIVERHCDHHRHILSWKIARDRCSVL